MRSSDARQLEVQHARDTGLAMVLLCLLALLLAGPRTWLLAVAIALLVAVMTCPQVFAPLARGWFGLSRLLGAVVSRLLLSAIFFTVVTPVALLRRVTGADPLRLKQWRRASASVFAEREQAVTATDLERPY